MLFSRENKTTSPLLIATNAAEVFIFSLFRGSQRIQYHVLV